MRTEPMTSYEPTHEESTVRQTNSDAHDVLASGSVTIKATDAGTDVPIKDDGRPEECNCTPYVEPDGLPCWPCFRDGFENPHPNPDPSDER